MIAETQARLERLQAKQDHKMALSDKRLLPLTNTLSAAKGQIIKAQKGLGIGPQSFGARIEKHQLWIDQIEAERAIAEGNLEIYQNESDILMLALSVAGSVVSTGGDPTSIVEDTLEEIENAGESDDRNTAHYNYEQARSLRLGNTEESEASA